MDIQAIQKLTEIEQFDVIHVDADSWCYDCANLEDPIELNKKGIRDYVQYVYDRVPTDRLILHVTLGNKGGRKEIYPDYQNNRKTDPELSARVKILREYIAETYTEGKVQSRPWRDIEADDGIGWCQANCREQGIKSAIMSIDKDLNMLEGWHIEPKTYITSYVERNGKTWWTKTESGKDKFIGNGLMWFWHQMLFGDRVDNIKGLPYLTPKLANRYVPTKKFNPKRKPLSCGEKRGIAVLEGVTDHKEAFRRVREAYVEYFGRTGDEELFLQAFLLWIRTSDDTLDILHYFRELGFNYQLTAKQQAAIVKYEESRNDG